MSDFNRPVDRRVSTSFVGESMTHEPDTNVDNWPSYRRLILAEIKRLNDTLDRVTADIAQFRATDLAKLRTDITLLKFQAGLWGGLMGVLFSTAVSYLIKG